MRVFSLLLLSCLLSFYHAKPYPVAVFHGLGDMCIFPGMHSFTNLISNKLNNTYVRCIEIGIGSLSSIFMNFESQAESACSSLKSDNNLRGEISVVGLSQGALIARYIAEKCDFNGTVRRWISIGGPNMGVAKFPRCTYDTICWPLNSITRSVVYSWLIQNTVGPAGYFKDPANYQTFLDKSVFLADLNNEKSDKDSKAKERMLQLEKIVLVKFNDDTMIIPRETAWFGFYDKDEKTVVNYNETDLYKTDYIGLRELNEAGKINFVGLPGNHLQFSDNDIEEYFIPALS